MDRQKTIMIFALIGWGLFVGVNVTKSLEVKECQTKIDALTKPAQ